MRAAAAAVLAAALAATLVPGQAQQAAPALTAQEADLVAQRDALQTALVRRDAAALQALIRGGLALDFNFDDLKQARTGESPLTLAIHRGHLDMARLLLEGGASARRPDSWGRPPIHQARSREAVQLLMAFGAELDAPGPGRLTAAAEAALRADLVTLDALLAAGAHFSSPGAPADILARAVEAGRPELIEALLQRGVDPRQPPTQALWPLIERGDAPRARLLLARGADANARKDRDSLLNRALFRQRWEIAEALLDAGADPRLPDPRPCAAGVAACGSTLPAQLASFNPAVLARMKANGLDLDAVDAQGHTALTALIAQQPLAVQAVGRPASRIPAPDNVARVRALLDAGASPNRRAGELTPLMQALVAREAPPEMAALLVARGARIEYEATVPPPAPDDRARPFPGRPDNLQGVLTRMSVGPLTWAALQGRPEVALALLERDRALGAADRDLLYFAAAGGQWELLLRALPYSRHVDAANRAGVTPLLLAADAGRADVVQALLAAGANVNQRSASDWPPLLERGNWLGALGGHPSRPPLVGGYTPLRAATSRGHRAVVQLLRAAGGRD